MTDRIPKYNNMNAPHFSKKFNPSEEMGDNLSLDNEVYIEEKSLSTDRKEDNDIVYIFPENIGSGTTR